MPISKKVFENGGFVRRKSSIKEHPVFVFLSKNSHNAYTIKELSAATKKNPATIRSMLRKLMEKGYVKHKTPYWAISSRASH